MRLYSVLFFVLTMFSATMSVSGTLSGNIYDKQGRPVNGAPIQIQKVNSKRRSFSYTRHDGSFSFKKLPSGKYIIRSYIGNKKIQREISVEQKPVRIELKTNDVQDINKPINDSKNTIKDKLEQVNINARSVINIEAVKLINSEAAKTITPEVAKNLNPEAARTISPEVAKHLNPEAAKTIAPEVARNLNPQAAKTIAPGVAKHLNPEAAKTISPDVAKHLNPAAARTISPGVAKHLNPLAAKNITSSSAKRLSPEAAKHISPTDKRHTHRAYQH